MQARQTTDSDAPGPFRPLRDRDRVDITTGARIHGAKLRESHFERLLTEALKAVPAFEALPDIHEGDSTAAPWEFALEAGGKVATCRGNSQSASLASVIAVSSDAYLPALSSVANTFIAAYGLPKILAEPVARALAEIVLTRLSGSAASLAGDDMRLPEPVPPDFRREYLVRISGEQKTGKSLETQITEELGRSERDIRAFYQTFPCRHDAKIGGSGKHEPPFVVATLLREDLRRRFEQSGLGGGAPFKDAPSGGEDVEDGRVGDLVPRSRAFASRFDDASSPQNREVLRGVGGFHSDALLDLADCETPSPLNRFENSDPHRVAERSKQVGFAVLQCCHRPAKVPHCSLHANKRIFEVGA